MDVPATRDNATVDNGSPAADWAVGGRPDSAGVTETVVPAGQSGGYPRLDAAFYILAAAIGAGFLVTLFGTYVVPSALTVLAGVVIIVVAISLWIVAAFVLLWLLIKLLIKRRFRGAGNTSR